MVTHVGCFHAYMVLPTSVPCNAMSDQDHMVRLEEMALVVSVLPLFSKMFHVTDRRQNLLLHHTFDGETCQHSLYISRNKIVIITICPTMLIYITIIILAEMLEKCKWECVLSKLETKAPRPGMCRDKDNVHATSTLYRTMTGRFEDSNSSTVSLAFEIFHFL